MPGPLCRSMESCSIKTFVRWRIPAGNGLLMALFMHAFQRAIAGDCTGCLCPEGSRGQINRATSDRIGITASVGTARLRMGKSVYTSNSHNTEKSGNTSDPNWVSQQLESNLASYWLGLGRLTKGSLHVSDELSWEDSGGPYFNRVVDAHLSREVVDDRIDEIKQTFTARGAAITWLLGPSATPPDLGKYLSRQGFSYQESWAGMAHSLSGLETPPAVPDGITVREVQDQFTCRDWLTVVGRSFRLPRQARRVLHRSVLATTRSGVDNEWTHYIVYLNDKPAAASTLFVQDGVGGIYLVSTLPEMRGSGLGSYATWLALRRAQSIGCTLAVLQSTPQARSVYRRLGFGHYCDIDVYRYETPAPTWKRVARSGLRRLRRSFRNANGRTEPGVRFEPELMAERQQNPSHIH